jgi:hypothetical protein
LLVDDLIALILKQANELSEPFAQVSGDCGHRFAEEACGRDVVIVASLLDDRQMRFNRSPL